jgi:DNA-binding transcriptional regulator GbsR (MarR family)
MATKTKSKMAPYERILMQQIARLTAEKENLDFQNREYQEIIADMNQRLQRQTEELTDYKKLSQELNQKLERLSQI